MGERDLLRLVRGKEGGGVLNHSVQRVGGKDEPRKNEIPSSDS